MVIRPTKPANIRKQLEANGADILAEWYSVTVDWPDADSEVIEVLQQSSRVTVTNEKDTIYTIKFHQH